MDRFIVENRLKWIPYNKFENIEYLNKGGFGIIYKATYNGTELVLKCFNHLNNSDEELNEFLNQRKIIYSLHRIINILGFTKNPVTSNFMLIMEYANKGNLRECLPEIKNDWNYKLLMLLRIIDGLNRIHRKGLIHCDFHDGNILFIECKHAYSSSSGAYGAYISDYLGSYQSAKSFLGKDNIYGVIPFMAPEVLRGRPYTPASDIYSFSIIMWEFTSGIPPFNNRAHDFQLALSICKGERPEIIENTPQRYIDLMKRCWDEDPLRRPSASEVKAIIKEWFTFLLGFTINDIGGELRDNIIMEFNKNVPTGYNNSITETHLQACYTSRLLSFTSVKLNDVLLKQEFFELEKIAETYYQSSQNEIKENRLVYQNIQIELINLQQRNSQFEQDNQNLELNLTVQTEEFTKKENILQAQITHLQNEKQALADNLTKQLEQNEMTTQQYQIQINLLSEEKNNLQDQLTQKETIFQGLKDQYKNQLIQFQNNYKQMDDENLKLEKIAETYYQSSQNELKEKQFAYQNIQMELINLQQKFERDVQNLRLNLAEKENTLQAQITNLQNEKQALVNNLTKQLEQNEMTTQQFQIQINKLNQEKNSLQDQLTQKETNIQELKDQYENQLIQFQSNHEQIEDENLKLKKIAESSQNELKEIQAELERNTKLQQQKIDQLQQSEKENDNLYQKNVKLANQLEKRLQQNALPNNELSNYQLEVSNQSYGMNLNNDITKLNDSLKKYITDLNQNVIINIEEIKKLLLLYKCPTKITSQRDDRLLIQTVLQRHIIETIISHATVYFQSTGQHYHLESDIINKASSLSTLLTNISKYRTGNDKIAHEALTKLRKQIYLILNSYGFANIYEENNTTYEHPFIVDCKKKLNSIINELRVVKDQEKIVVENLAATIISEVIKIFWFRLKVDESVVQYVWIPSNVKVDKIFMEKNNCDEIDDEENLYVDLCYFPLIGKNLTSNDQKVYIPAKVIVQKNYHHI
ncbi:hypothetical protein RclHR1_01120017 [Rhizophagus clarus]|uniref:Kinase-like domain-containing protein n=1 Tax=Rhizophagus clarus TaxID=94130 RepID=A0A2Z6QFV3_9GLOM|nr:hypothetical protein RclHR1_01120017 [Rhizophagus clarus]GET04557.1 kinase-like domain-containing protein [Rhizophagus clarus]